MIFNDFPTQESYEFELEQVMKHITDCHGLMLFEKKLVPNDENDIRSYLVEGYLNDSKIRRKIGLIDYLFDAEVGVFRPVDYKQVGRSDIKVSLKSSTFSEPKNHFIIECKRIDGDNNLNREYVKEGVNRFISQLYPTNLNINGMVGFCIKSFDIHINSIQNINNHLSKWCLNETISSLKKGNFIENFEYTYISHHRTTSSKQEFKLYHLMLDMTSILE